LIWNVVDLPALVTILLAAVFVLFAVGQTNEVDAVRAHAVDALGAHILTLFVATGRTVAAGSVDQAEAIVDAPPFP